MDPLDMDPVSGCDIRKSKRAQASIGQARLEK
jgi:hypothetical protein